MNTTKIKEKAGQAIFTVAAVICVIAVAAIFVFMLIKSIPAFNKIGLFDFILGDDWSPDRLDKYENATLSGSYGILKMIVSTLAATVGALLIGGTLGFFAAVFIAFYCPKRLKRIFSSMINLLAGIPSVVYGFFGIVFLLPLLANFAPNNGSGLLATSLILGIMIMPTVVSLSKTSLEAVPRAYYEGALALGSTHSQAVFGTVTKAAKSGVTASLVLGIGRALGETMAVVMVAGNSVAYPDSLFNSFRVLTANIVMEMGYAGEVQQGALVATGVILLVFVLIVNLVFGAISKRAIKGAVEGKGLFSKIIKRNEKTRKATFWTRCKDKIAGFKYKIKTANIGAGAAIGAGAFAGTVLLLVIGFIFIKGFPTLISSPHLLFGKYEFDSEKITILPSIITTLMTVALSLLISVPIGLCTAIFLNEYAKKNNFFIKVIRGAIDLLNGVPSIVYGLFGMITFVSLIGGTSSILAGTLTISIMLLPTIVRSTEESLKSVQNSLREGSLALGAGKMRTIFKIVLPCALPGIISAIILSMGRVIAESAPFIYTMGSVISATPTGYLDSNATLAVALYRLSGEGWYVNEAYATAVVLIILVLGLNLLAELIASKLNKRLQGDK
ncbi:MAG: phosphate ABC transporter permease subunit PstC [Clostridia bacterium]|nr:phosphate ABC transporter permease subunit PstC [Clostridia bacterium]MBQ8739714.1 phosphate ABC transporter permease subunit PstC [Clostridia bacterium]